MPQQKSASTCRSMHVFIPFNHSTLEAQISNISNPLVLLKKFFERQHERQDGIFPATPQQETSILDGPRRNFKKDSQMHIPSEKQKPVICMRGTRLSSHVCARIRKDTRTKRWHMPCSSSARDSATGMSCKKKLQKANANIYTLQFSNADNVSFPDIYPKTVRMRVCVCVFAFLLDCTCYLHTAYNIRI